MNRAFQSLEEYGMTSFNLPDDHSLISPIAKVILQKRRLLKIQEIHDNLLFAALTTEDVTKKESRLEFLNLFKKTFSKVHWNELSVSEAQNLSALIVDTLKFCQAENQMINSLLKEVLVELQSANLSTRFLALRSSLILLQYIFPEFPKQAGAWTADVLKYILVLFKESHHASESHFDCILEGLKCLQVVLKHCCRSIDKKELEKIHSIAVKFIKAKSIFIALEASKVFELNLTCSGLAIPKKDVKTILELLNSNLSSRLYENCCHSTRLLSLCFEFNPEMGPMRLVQLFSNIERVRSYSYIDSRLFADSMASVLLNWNREDLHKVLNFLLPRKGSKSFVSPECFSQIIQVYVQRLAAHSESVKAIRFIFESILLSDLLCHCPLEYYSELINVLTGLYLKFPESLSEMDFSAFSPLTFPNERVQIKSVRLITTVMSERPLVLTSQIILIFAQLKGDFLRIKMKENDVVKTAVNGLMKLFASILDLTLFKYGNYCDPEIIDKIKDWVLSYLCFNEDTEWLKEEPQLLHGILLISASLKLKDDDFKITLKVIELMNSSMIDHIDHLEAFLEYFIHVVGDSLERYTLFFGSFEKCFHELNSHPVLRNTCVRKLVPVMRIISENSRNEFLSIGAVCYFSKVIAFKAFPSGQDNIVDFDFDLLTSCTENQTFSQMTEYFAKMFWKSSMGVQDYCLTLWTAGIKNRTIVQPLHILRIIRALLENSDIKFENENHRTILIDHIQSIGKEFLSTSDYAFELRVECGIVLGLIVNLFNLSDNAATVELFQQFMKHSMKSDSSKDQSSRVSYIMGLVSLKASLETKQLKYIDVTSNALLGLLASWNRESLLGSKSTKRQIEAVTILALSFYIEQCGCLVNSEFYRDSCELLLEQVFAKDRNELVAKSVKQLAKSISLYVNLLPCQAEFITRTIRVILESKYLFSFDCNSNTSLLLEISDLNPQIASPSQIILTDLKLNISCYNLGIVCRYLSHHVSLSLSLANCLIDSGLLIVIIESFNDHGRGCVESDYESIFELLQQMFIFTLTDRFSFWMDSIFAAMSSSHSPIQAATKEISSIALSGSALSLSDGNRKASDNSEMTVQLTPNMIHLLVKCINLNLHQLIMLPPREMNQFVSFAIKLSFSVSVEKSNQREFFFSGIFLLRGLVRLFSSIRIDNDGVSILESFDSQIVSIISSTLRSAEDIDPLYAACAFGTLFSLILNRRDLRVEIDNGNGRIVNILKKALTFLQENQMNWSEERVENLIILSIIVGIASLQQVEFDLNNCLGDSKLSTILKSNFENCFKSFRQGMLEKNIQLSLSSQDRLMLISSWISLYDKSEEVDAEIINGILLMLSSMHSSSAMEQICSSIIELFSLDLGDVSLDISIVEKLLQKIYAFGLETKDPLSVEVLAQISLASKRCKDVASIFLTKLTKEFLSTRFGDFDALFGLALLNAQLNSDLAQDIFPLLNKLIEVCFNDLEVNNCNDMLKILKRIFVSNLDASFIEKANELLRSWIGRLEDVNSIFLNQLVFFCISTCPQIWSLETYNLLQKHFEKMIKNINTIDGALDSWILLLKCRSKGNDEADLFVKYFDIFTQKVKNSFEKHRGSGVDQIWERIFGIALNICRTSDSKALIELGQFLQDSLDDLNDFK